MSMDTQQLLSPQQAAKLIGIDRTTLARWRREGRISAAFHAPGKQGAYLYDINDVEALAAREGVKK